MAIVNTATAALSLVRSVRLVTLEDGDWALRLPGSQRLLAGGAMATYAIDAQTLTARPFSFFAAGTSDATDIDSSALVLSGSHGFGMSRCPARAVDGWCPGRRGLRCLRRLSR